MSALTIPFSIMEWLVRSPRSLHFRSSHTAMACDMPYHHMTYPISHPHTDAHCTHSYQHHHHANYRQLLDYPPPSHLISSLCEGSPGQQQGDHLRVASNGCRIKGRPTILGKILHYMKYAHRNMSNFSKRCVCECISTFVCMCVFVCVRE